jgi:hypothetical protein
MQIGRFLRLTQVLHDEADGLGRVELGTGQLVTVLEGFDELGAAADPAGEMVAGHMGRAVREIHQGKL